MERLIKFFTPNPPHTQIPYKVFWYILLLLLPGTILVLESYFKAVLTGGETDVSEIPGILLFGPIFIGIFNPFIFIGFAALLVPKRIPFLVRLIAYPAIGAGVLYFLKVGASSGSTSFSFSHGNGNRLVTTVNNGQLTVDGWNELYATLMAYALCGVILAIGHYLFDRGRTRPNPYFTIKTAYFYIPALALAIAWASHSPLTGNRRSMTWGYNKSILTSEKKLIVNIGCGGDTHGGTWLRLCYKHYDGQHFPQVADTSCSKTLPILCIRPDTITEPKELADDRFKQIHGWSGASVALSEEVKGSTLTSREIGDGLCHNQFGQEWRMADAKDPVWYSGFWADGTATPLSVWDKSPGKAAQSRFWIAGPKGTNCWK